MVAVGVGTRCPAIGAGGEADGFPRIARLTTMRVAGAATVDGVPTAMGRTPMEVGADMVIGEDPTKIGTVQTGS